MSNKLADLILASNGKMFSVTFTKVTTGEDRTMTARLGVKRHLKGGVSTHNADTTITVFDMNAKDERSGYRAIHKHTIKSVTIDGITHTV